MLLNNPSHWGGGGRGPLTYFKGLLSEAVGQAARAECSSSSVSCLVSAG